MTNPADMRRSYERGELLEDDIGSDPFIVFQTWFRQAEEAGELEPNAMTLSTCAASGAPRSRVVLLKELSADGRFVFFTNYESAKGRELSDSPWAALNFLWLRAERQVRIEGAVERVSDEVSAQYFASRPRASQLGAWASAQSQPIASRAALEARYQEVEARFEGQEIPRPEFWGGFALTPSAIEFWQGRVGRLHDRLCFERVDEAWKVLRRMP